MMWNRQGSPGNSGGLRSAAHRRHRTATAILSVAVAGAACAPPPQTPPPSAPDPTSATAEARPSTTAPDAPGKLSQPLVHRQNERFEVHGSPDVVDAMHGDLEFATAIFARYFPSERPTLGVVAFMNAAEMRAFDWSAIKARRQQTLPWLVQMSQSPTVSASSVEGTRALSHEACHKYLMAYMASTVPPAAGEQRPAGMPPYGAPSLPDWLDEAVAVLCESEQLQSQRLAAMRGPSNREKLIPLADLLTMEHPVAKALGSFIAAQHKAMMDSSGTQRRNETMMRVTPPPGMLDGARSAQFYAQSYSLAAFLAEHEGPAFLSHLAGALARGKTMEDVLKEPGRKLPRDVASLERAWKTWAGLD